MFDRRRFLIASAAAAAGSYATMLDAAAVPHAASAKSSQDAIRKFLAHITPERLRARLYFIASDLFEGRDTGSFGQHATALYLGSEYVQLGFTPGFAGSGPLIPEVSAAVHDADLAVCSVLSGNRNFEGRINPDVKMNYLASPPLVVAYALAGSLDVDQGSVLRYDEADFGYARGGESEFRFFLGGCQPCHEQRKQTDQNGPQERG